MLSGGHRRGTGSCTCHRPLGRTHGGTLWPSGRYGSSRNGGSAGLPLVGERKDSSKLSTYGVGLQIAHAVKPGAKKIILGLGGSATNDGGCGCAAALGVCFLNVRGERFVPTGENLHEIVSADKTEAEAFLRDVRWKLCAILITHSVDPGELQPSSVRRRVRWM